MVDLSSLVKLFICMVILISFFVVYFWEPKEKKKNERKEVGNGVLNYIEVDVDVYSKNASVLRPTKRRERFSQSELTLTQLEEYVRALKENRVHNLDDV